MTPTKAFSRYWIKKGIKGCVINMTSMTSYKALSGTWAYDAAKAGVLNLNEALAKELAPHGIRVNAIAPGFFVGNQNRAPLRRKDGRSHRARQIDHIAHAFRALRQIRGTLGSGSLSGERRGIRFRHRGKHSG